MKNKKGFTLVELLAVIVILAIIIGIGITASMTISNKSRDKMYETKIEMIEKAATLYVQDKPSVLNENGGLVTVKKLLDKGYLKKDNEDGTVRNPVDNKSLNNCSLKVTRKNNRYVAEIIDTNECKW